MVIRVTKINEILSLKSSVVSVDILIIIDLCACGLIIMSSAVLVLNCYLRSSGGGGTI